MKRVTLTANLASQDRATMEGDAEWATLKTLTQPQLDAWLESNVRSLQDMRRVLKLLIVATRSVVQGEGRQ